MSKYNPQKIEKKWQRYWETKKFYRAKDKSGKAKKYVLIEFPYPSGEGLHMGHLRPYVAGDVYSRYLRMKGGEVMYPIGWDAFGLPAENFAIKKGVHPKISTAKNIKNAKNQLKSWGISFEWSREVNTTDPAYYRWTQWMFLQFFKAGLAYEATGLINWCPKDKTGLANEEVIDGKCERCGTQVEKKELRQWYLKITAYADKLLEGLKDLNWPEAIKLQQENWIGRSEGANIKFKISGPELKFKEVEIFTTRPDTLFGATFLVISPELAKKWMDFGWVASSEIQKYIEDSILRGDQKRQIESKDKTGIFTGVYAVNPANKEKIPVWTADYVLSGYGTGAIMAVPAHDQRDFDFAKKFNLPIKMVICPNWPAPKCPILDEAYEGYGYLVDSEKFDGMESERAKWEITKFVGGVKKVQYKLRDWVFSRQRYWGEPIPIVHCLKCGVVAVPEKDLPVKLPNIKKYQPTGTGESPLAAVKEWVNVKCPSCRGEAKRETNTMPQWAGSSWYYLRYIDPKNKKQLAKPELLKHWLPVDIYFGGLEHTTLHLLYSRFWHKFLFDQKVVPTPEPYNERVPHGIILGPDREKMSKSRGNIVDPQDIVKKYGADVLRMFEMFLGPHGDAIAWQEEGIVGVHRFLNRFWNFVNRYDADVKPNPKAVTILNKYTKEIGDDIKNHQFNTGVSGLMKLLNELEPHEISKKEYGTLLKLLAPFAPHMAEELWYSVLKKKNSIHLEKWPEYDEKLLAEEKIKLVVQVNGRVRDTIEVSKGLSEVEANKLAMIGENVKKHITGEVKKVIYVQDRIINFVV